jgi:hypothetical protein
VSSSRNPRYAAAGSRVATITARAWRLAWQCLHTLRQFIYEIARELRRRCCAATPKAVDEMQIYQALLGVVAIKCPEDVM